MDNKQKKSLYKIIISVVLFAICIFLETDNPYINILLFMVPYFVVGASVLKDAFLRIKNKQMLDENFLMSIATIGAFIIGEYPEAVFVMLFYRVGELFEGIAVGKSRKSISALTDICPEYANVIIDGKVETIDPYDVNVGDIIIVKSGERIPIDGVVIEGEASIDTSSLTGEAEPVDVYKGKAVFSGCVNIDGMLKICTQKTYESSSVSKIIEIIESSQDDKSKAESFITRFSKYYTPVVVILAFLIALIGSVFGTDVFGWVKRGLIFLVVSCPCALVISVPMTFFCAMGSLGRSGILAKSSLALENLSYVRNIAFDKTGTITKGMFKVAEICPVNMTEDKLLAIGAMCEMYSDHPLAKAIVARYGNDKLDAEVTNYKTHPGLGVSCEIQGITAKAGNARFMKKEGIECLVPDSSMAVVHVSFDNKYAGYILMDDEIKNGVNKEIAKLKKIGIKTTILTGDKDEVASKMANIAGVDDYYAELLPQDKVEYAKGLKKDGKLCFVGDGINDAPVLHVADVGISMGALGSDAAIESSDIVIMDDKISGVVKAVNVSKKAMGIVRQNIIFALTIKFGVLILASFGIANMWEASFADVGVSVIAILNAMRILRNK